MPNTAADGDQQILPTLQSLTPRRRALVYNAPRARAGLQTHRRACSSCVSHAQARMAAAWLCWHSHICYTGAHCDLSARHSGDLVLSDFAACWPSQVQRGADRSTRHGRIRHRQGGTDALDGFARDGPRVSRARSVGRAADAWCLALPACRAWNTCTACPRPSCTAT